MMPIISLLLIALFFGGAGYYGGYQVAKKKFKVNDPAGGSGSGSQSSGPSSAKQV